MCNALTKTKQSSVNAFFHDLMWKWHLYIVQNWQYVHCIGAGRHLNLVQSHLKKTLNILVICVCWQYKVFQGQITAEVKYN